MLNTAVMTPWVARPSITPAGSRRWKVQVAWASSTSEGWQQVASPCPSGYQ